MQNKGIVITTAVLLTLVSLFYLSFPIATSYYDSQAAKRPDAVAQQDYKDSVKYLGIYSYQKCLETQIGLGLDLKGGMNVILEISVPDVVENLADHKTDIAFTRSMDEARKEQQATQGDFITLFINAYHKNAPGHKLAEVFSTTELQGKVSPTSTDGEVEKALRSEVSAAIDNSFNVVRTRIDQFGVVQPNIQKVQGTEGRISVEMPGIREPERMRKLLQGSANLEFWETYNADEVLPYLQQLDQRMANGDADEKDETDSVKADKDVAAAKATAEKEVKQAKQEQPKFQIKGKNAKKNIQATPDAQLQEAKKLHPLLAMLQTTGQGLSVCGYASVRDTAAINKIIYSRLARQILPSDLKLLWSAKPADGIQAKNIFELHALKVTTTNGRAPLEGDVVVQAKDEFNQVTGQPEVSMTMNSDGARRWAELTKANVGKAIAIVLDNVVYSAPRVNGEISGGQSAISGNFTVQDTKDLANTLNSGRMPAPAHIVQEEVVGPTLGAQSIQQGLVSFIVAFILLIFFMLAIYNIIPGSIAIGALLINVFFTLGILTSFQAALTMSGIAGMVLSLGTAVDANVLVYERIKEELRKGKDMRKAISEGYSNAFSAIFDSNLTSLITGIILLVVGTGPIRGFATTWIIGIVCNFFTAVYLTRLLYEYKLNHGHWMHLKFWTGFSKNLMQNTKYPFMSMYKTSFVLYAVAIAIAIGSFAVRGLSRSIDFTGGRNYVVTLNKSVPVEDVRPVLQNAFVNTTGNNKGKLATTTVIALGTDGKTIRVSTNWDIDSNDPNADDKAETILYNGLHKAGFVSQASVDAFKNPDIRQGGSIISSSKVGPSVAKDITRNAVYSVGLALLCIFLYILIRFRNVGFSVGSILALAIDTTMVIGLFSLCYGWIGFSLEIDQTFIGAILTVIGYDINDSVVVFDRIRENLRLHPKGDMQKIFNDSINETLARTINTSLSTLIVLLAIFILGGDSIRSFSFAMIVGVFVGTLSSIFLASPIAYIVLGKKIEKRDNGIAEVAAAEPANA
ncbi:protein translocase subunit SecDF [Hallella multisaccharivorax DSM 17128]|uniref:Multifunctional fusion protein n=1 Tax=Hallella multisaccharivorax DSM 17128 TaxID=688246 RepID=F8N689_9BACT|nr:protein translocase subunit SecDF [Hallella multisaccharivorax]EGN56170.1 protein translocase subunit secF;protein translocase subunit secD [Hallella multisaccharivorax DSM 17128]GJG29673.1 protein translocase subunit SecDF [Hallella multisaccharivorax DSM 17128]